ncbi:hypothetical protein KDA_43780 [Dictyobacter alpinus]|uniref:Uncharacterized protein n=1 Tax=Dictyobacter alpinus TaxID=2014873 RepID=A0A402BC32_9CHLR|nr:hypothetical protein [Dictyobacter alpinus]GCE28894.1 hypothetical protein KDA_43780 [Dictyobacter alpinus]
MLQPSESAIPKGLFITSYWPRQQGNDENIGFGVSRDYMLYRVASMLQQRSLRFFILPRLRAKLPLLILVNILATIPNTISNTMIMRGWLHNKKGYYVLDDEGKALSFLGARMPENLMGRMGMGRQKFLRRLSQQ